jgi:hypothetical protein
LSQSPAPAASPLTVRAVCLGLVFSVLLNLVMVYSDFKLEGTFLVGNHFPVASIAVLLALVLFLNPALRFFFKARGLQKGELLLIWSMLGVAGGIGAAGFFRYLPAWLAGPSYLATPSNDFEPILLKSIPHWMLLSHAPKDQAVSWFFEGLPAGKAIPWGRWLLPLATWTAFGLCLYLCTFAFTSLFFHQWAARERLTFALVHVPSELSQEAGEGKFLNGLLSNRLAWAGGAIAFSHGLINGLHQYFAAIPAIPFGGNGRWFTDRPWSELDFGALYLYYSVVGLSFLLTTEMSFSIWFFFVLYRLSFVFVAWLGAPATGFWGDWENQVSGFDSAGAVLVLAGFLFWAARKSLAAWLGRVFSGGREDEEDLMPPRLTLIFLLLGFAGMTAWFLVAGVSWWAALLGVVVFLAVILVLTRIVAEAGMLNVGTGVTTFGLLTGLFPAAWLSGPTLAVMVMQQGVLMADLQCILMPYLMNGLKACRQAGMRGGRVLAVLGCTAALALVVGAYGRITTNYKYGGSNLDKLGNVWTPSWYLPAAVDFQKNPPEYHFLQVGNFKIMPDKAVHLLAGAVLTAAMLALRARYLWWPLHPLGLVICSQIAFVWIWFSVFLGWLAKASVMTFGGASAYRKVLPFFLGLVVGEYLVAALWIAVALLSGKPSYAMFMRW